ncbi:hypothetical protein [Komagataeibacter diospyri]|uniref:hypothetical protein n=1 Tax=Komagataeibacter diospyri TaxID=1932662 RepID=UPI0037569B1E
MKQDFTPVPAGELVALLSAKNQAAALNIHHQFRYYFMETESAYDRGRTSYARANLRMHDARQQDLERLILSTFMTEGPEIEAMTFRCAQAGRLQS